jgi:molecular chaperone GrpE (heat shock protein)
MTQRPSITRSLLCLAPSSHIVLAGFSGVPISHERDVSSNHRLLPLQIEVATLAAITAQLAEVLDGFRAAPTQPSIAGPAPAGPPTTSTSADSVKTAIDEIRRDLGLADQLQVENERLRKDLVRRDTLMPAITALIGLADGLDDVFDLATGLASPMRSVAVADAVRVLHGGATQGLSQYGIRQQQVQVHDVFNPERHEIVDRAVADGNSKPGTVAKVFKCLYVGPDGRAVRPAWVSVFVAE